MAVLSWTDFNNGETLANIRSWINTFNNNVVTNVNTNTTDIATNASGVADNVTDIAALDVRVTDNEADIATNVTNIATNVTDIADHETRLDDIENAGMTVRTGSNIAPQTIDVTPTRVVSFDTTAVEVGVGTLWDVANARMTATADGVFKLRYESFVSYASNVDITWQIYKNGATFGNSITLSGQGATVFPLVLLSSTNLLANDYLELHATATASTALTVVQANGTLEKTHF